MKMTITQLTRNTRLQLFLELSDQQLSSLWSLSFCSLTASAFHLQDTVRKFFQKLTAEDERFKERLEELEGAMNPDAENTIRTRHAAVRGPVFLCFRCCIFVILDILYDATVIVFLPQTRGRLVGELKDHVQSKMENLDNEHETLEYIRQRAELLLKEAKDVLLVTLRLPQPG